jgi:lipoate-protein ligase A
VTWDEAAAALAKGFAEALNLDWRPAPLTAREQALAEQMRLEKYATDGWNRRV